MKRSLARQRMKVIQDNINSLEVMAFTFQHSLKLVDDRELNHNAKILAGLASTTRAVVVKRGEEILKQLTERSLKNGKA